MKKKIITRERNEDFPNFWNALLLIALLMGLEILFWAGLYDYGVRFDRGDPRASVVTVLACGVIFSLLLSYKNLRYGELFSPGGQSIGSAVGPLVLPILTMSLGSVVIAAEVSNVLLYLFPLSDTELQAEEMLFSGGVVSVISLCLVAPFVEEMLFRGLFLRSFLRIYRPGHAILLSALLFGMVHGNVHQFVVAAPFGVLSGWLYYVTRSLWPAILEHAAYNGGVYLYNQSFSEAPWSAIAAPIPVHSAPILGLSLATFLIGLWWIFKVAPRVNMSSRKSGSEGNLG